MLIYTMLHSWVLTMEMLITHVVLTLNHSSWLQFCIINGVTELKISVFKKCDLAGLFNVNLTPNIARPPRSLPKSRIPVRDEGIGRLLEALLFDEDEQDQSHVLLSHAQGHVQGAPQAG